MPAPAKNQNAAKPAKDRASYMLGVRMTPAEKTQLVRDAQRRGLKLTAYARVKLGLDGKNSEV
jgi:hypothetical protein